MKKLFLGITAAAIAGVMCVGLVGCGGNVDAKGVKGEKVTEKQWNAALEAVLGEDAKFTIEYSSDRSVDYWHETMVHTTEWTAKTTERMTYTKNGALESAIGSMEISYTGDEEAAEYYVGSKAKKKEIEIYSEIVEGDIYNYEKGQDGRWTKEEAYSSVVTGEFGSVIGSMVDSYDYFVYSAEHQGYVSKYYEEGDSDVQVFKFKDGKLVALYVYYEDLEIDDKGQEYEKKLITIEANITIKYTAKNIVLPIVLPNIY